MNQDKRDQTATIGSSVLVLCKLSRNLEAPHTGSADEPRLDFFPYFSG